MINILLPFHAMWLILLAGVLTNILKEVNSINQKSPDDVLWYTILKKFFRKEWASYGMSVICTFIIAYSLEHLKKFTSVDARVSKYAWLVPIAPAILYLVGILNQWLLYQWLGRIKNKGEVDVKILTEDKK